jgi:hypothetical protein
VCGNGSLPKTIVLNMGVDVLMAFVHLPKLARKSLEDRPALRCMQRLGAVQL